jgi:hypothetical protein
VSSGLPACAGSAPAAGVRRRAALAAAAAALLAAAAPGCAASPGFRQIYLEAHPEIDPAVRAAIEQGRVEKGMTPEQVEAALGPPDSRRSFDEEAGRVEIWTYPGALASRGITRSATDTDYRVRLVFRNGALEDVEDL